jgi:polygalacturonase
VTHPDRHAAGGRHDSACRQADTPDPTRRAFIGLTGAALGSALLGACGGSSDPGAKVVANAQAATGATAGGGATMQAVADAAGTLGSDPVWGRDGAATRIIALLRGSRRSAFAGREFHVTAFGAAPCAVVAATSPYTDPTKSPLTDIAGQTPAPNSFDSRPAFLAAIAACHAVGGGRVVVPSGTWYCAGPIVLQSGVNFHLSRNCTIYFSPNPAD